MLYFLYRDYFAILSGSSQALMLDNCQTVPEKTLFIKVTDIVIVLLNGFQRILNPVLGTIVVMHNIKGKFAEIRNVLFYKGF